jgi:hypothetical protein
MDPEARIWLQLNPEDLTDPNPDLLDDFPIGIDLLHYHEIAASAEPPQWFET